MKAWLDDRARANEVRYAAEQSAGADGDERPALHWSVRAVTAQREALAGQNLFHAWMCLAGGIKDDKRGAFTYDIWASAHRSVSKEAPARTRKHTSESKVWVQRRRESS